MDSARHLRLRVVPGAVEEAVIATARAEVDAIWARYNVTLVWEPKWLPGTTQPELWVQFVDKLFTSESGAHAIAWIPFVDGAPRHYVRVSLPAARRLLAAKTWWGDGTSLAAALPDVQRLALGRVIGRALAHEIGHYLLASPVHARRGLMQAMLRSDVLLQPGRLDELRLAADDVRTLRAARLASCEVLARDQQPAVDPQ